MPTLNDTRVRVEGLSNRTATALGPARTWWSNGAFLKATARSRTCACSAGVRSSSRRKWRTMAQASLSGDSVGVRGAFGALGAVDAVGAEGIAGAVLGVEVGSA